MKAGLRPAFFINRGSDPIQATAGEIKKGAAAPFLEYKKTLFLLKQKLDRMFLQLNGYLLHG